MTGTYPGIVVMELSQTTQSVLKKHLGESMRDYRTAKGLTQEILIQKMGSVGVHYDRSKVSNRERAKVRPEDDHIRAFGKVLDLPPSVVESLIERAGLAWRKRVSPKREASLPEKFGQPGATEVDADANKGPVISYAGNAVGQILSRFVLPGLAVAAPGVVLAAFGWNAAWVLALYACLAIGLVLGQAFLRLRRSNDLRELLFVSLFLLLSTPLLQFPLTRMDHYGWYALGDLAGTPVPLLLALLVNLVIALAAAMMSDHLWRWQYADASDERRAYARSGWVVLPPLAFVYCTQVLFSNVGGWIYFLILMTVLAGVFTALVVLREMTFVRPVGAASPCCGLPWPLSSSFWCLRLLVSSWGTWTPASWPCPTTISPVMGGRLRGVGISRGRTDGAVTNRVSLGIVNKPDLHANRHRRTPGGGYPQPEGPRPAGIGGSGRCGLPAGRAGRDQWLEPDQRRNGGR